jgi:hypothetical protein
VEWTEDGGMGPRCIYLYAGLRRRVDTNSVYEQLKWGIYGLVSGFYHCVYQVLLEFSLSVFSSIIHLFVR